MRRPNRDVDGAAIQGCGKGPRVRKEKFRGADKPHGSLPSVTPVPEAGGRTFLTLFWYHRPP